MSQALQVSRSSGTASGLAGISSGACGSGRGCLGGWSRGGAGGGASLLVRAYYVAACRGAREVMASWVEAAVMELALKACLSHAQQQRAGAEREVCGACGV